MQKRKRTNGAFSLHIIRLILLTIGCPFYALCLECQAMKHHFSFKRIGDFTAFPHQNFAKIHQANYTSNTDVQCKCFYIKIIKISVFPSTEKWPLIPLFFLCKNKKRGAEWTRFCPFGAWKYIAWWRRRVTTQCRSLYYMDILAIPALKSRIASILNRCF